MTNEEFEEGLAKPEAQELLERASDQIHDQWSNWMKHLFDRCTVPHASMSVPSGAVLIPPILVERWKRQLSTPYKDLSEPEKDSDRREAKKLIKIFCDMAEEHDQ